MHSYFEQRHVWVNAKLNNGTSIIQCLKHFKTQTTASQIWLLSKVMKHICDALIYENLCTCISRHSKIKWNTSQWGGSNLLWLSYGHLEFLTCIQGLVVIIKWFIQSQGFPFVVKSKLFAVNLISFNSHSLSCPSTLPLLNIRLVVCWQFRFQQSKARTKMYDLARHLGVETQWSKFKISKCLLVPTFMWAFVFVIVISGELKLQMVWKKIYIPCWFVIF